MKNDFDRSLFDTGRVSPYEHPILERPDTDTPAEYKKPFTSIPIVRFVFFALMGVLALYILYSVLVHPIYKLNISMYLSKNCTATVKIEVPHDNGSYTGYAEMYLDGDLLAVASSKYADPMTYTYVEIDRPAINVYTYDKAEETWNEKVYDTSEAFFANYENGRLSANYGKYLQELFVRSNYERVKGKLTLWEIRDGVDMGPMTDVRFRRSHGKYVFSWNEGKNKYTLTVESFGNARVERLWEE